MLTAYFMQIYKKPVQLFIQLSLYANIQVCSEETL